MYYQNNNIADENARLCLAMFPRDVVEDIVDLVLKRGRAVVSDSQDESDNLIPSKVFGLLSKDYVPKGDFSKILVGFSAVAVAGLRKFDGDKQSYQAVLEGAFGIPTVMAKKIAEKIESDDPMYDPTSGSVMNWTSEAMDIFRRMANVVGNPLGLEYDADQDFDLDFLYELGALGTEIGSLNSRSKLIKGQAAAILNGAWFSNSIGSNADVQPQGGDVYSETGDVAMLGDLYNMSRITRTPIAAWGKAASLTIAANSAKKMAVDRKIKEDGPAPIAAFLKNAVDKVKANPLKALAIAGGVGLAPLAIKGIIKTIAKHKSKGDAFDAAYGDIVDEFGDSIADAWATGDIDSIVGDALLSSREVETTGDSTLDDDAYGDALEAAGDVFGDTVDSEVGGLFTKWRTNAAVRKAVRQNARADRKVDRMQAKMDRKATSNQMRIDKKNAKRDALNEARYSRGVSGRQSYPQSMIGQDEQDMMPEQTQQGYDEGVTTAQDAMYDNDAAYNLESFGDEGSNE